MSFNKEAFTNFIIENDIIGFFDQPITLSSGKESRFYINWRTVSEDVFLLNQASDFLIDFVNDESINVDTFFGVAEGATKLGLISQFKMASTNQNFKKGSHILSMGRGKHKTHGAAKDARYLGVPNGKVVVVEDVVTTGGSMIKSIDALKADFPEIKIVAVISLTDRESLSSNNITVHQELENRDIPYHTLAYAKDLLPKALQLKNKNDDESLKQAIMDEYKENNGSINL